MLPEAVASGAETRNLGFGTLQALTLLAIAFVHSDNRLTAAIAMAVFASAAAVSISIIVAQDRPFSGQLGVHPDVLLQVVPEGSLTDWRAPGELRRP